MVRKPRPTVRRNADAFGASDRVQILTGSALTLPHSDGFDLVFADPPYAPGSGTAVVQAVVDAGWLAPGGWMSVETSRGDDVEPAGLSVEAPATSAAPVLRFCAALSGLRRFLDLLDLVAEAPPDGVGGRLPGRVSLPCPARCRSRRYVLNPSSASAASAAVAATATSSATSGLWSSLMNASPAPADPACLERPVAREALRLISSRRPSPLFDVAFLAILKISCLGW